MDNSRTVGILICAGVIILGGLFIWGIAIQSYWAIAIPVLVGFLAILALGFWIGWTMASSEAEPPKVPSKEEAASGEASGSSS